MKRRKGSNDAALESQGQQGMNLNYVQTLLVGADHQSRGFIEVHGRKANRQVRLMVEAGLVDVTLGNDKDGLFTTIDCLTDCGRAFLRTFKETSVLDKWNVNFELAAAA